jgi:hypothetical protein
MSRFFAVVIQKEGSEDRIQESCGVLPAADFVDRWFGDNY